MGDVRQKLHFAPSDGEDEPVEDEGNSSTGAESGFTEMDSPPQARRLGTKKADGEEASSPLNRDDTEFWDEEFGFGSPSPKKAGQAYGRTSPERLYRREDREGSSSPIPDCPDTPPHKTFRKLRLFDTPHTPKVLLCRFPIRLKILVSAFLIAFLWRYDISIDVRFFYVKKLL